MDLNVKHKSIKLVLKTEEKRTLQNTGWEKGLLDFYEKENW